MFARVVIIFVLLLSFASTKVEAREVKPYIRYTERVENGDTVITAYLSQLFVFTNNRKGRALAKKYARLVNAVRVAYPIAYSAKYTLLRMEKKLLSLPESEHKAYVKEIEEELKERYTPILKRMSMYQGMVLLKLIDYETGNTSYDLVKELRGSFSAFFWQGIARLFGGNLKAQFDPDGDDKILNELIFLYKHGLI